MKSVILEEDYKHGAEVLYKGNTYPLADNLADALIIAGLAVVKGKKAKPRATKPVKIQPDNSQVTVKV